ncbi:MAG: hypothetical protein R3297_01385 [Desulfobulbales bacterium]|nr:hypothetical protein [Desulfobulbales bacterium]
MIKKISSLAILAFFLLICGYAAAGPGKPDFGPNVYADGIAWGTKATTVLPAPNDNNVQSYDILYVITNGADGQLPVSDAGPRNPNYNGGRWFTHTAMWTELGLVEMDPLPVLKSYEDIMIHYDAGHLDIWPGSPGGPPDYFQCPLLPVKNWE